MKAHLRRDKTSPYLSEATSQGLCQMAHIEEMESPPPAYSTPTQVTVAP